MAWLFPIAAEVWGLDMEDGHTHISYIYIIFIYNHIYDNREISDVQRVPKWSVTFSVNNPLSIIQHELPNRH